MFNYKKTVFICSRVMIILIIGVLCVLNVKTFAGQRLPVRFLKNNSDMAIQSSPLELFCQISNEGRDSNAEGSKARKRKLRVVMISASNEYVSNITLREYKNSLENNYSNIDVTLLQAFGPLNDKDEFSMLEGTDALKNCDVLLIFARRTTISSKALDDIRHYVNSGKPLVALRTSSHGFQKWPDFDKTVLGGNYSGHYEGDPEETKIGADGFPYAVGEPTGPVQQVSINPKNKNHSVLKGINNFSSKYSLYKTSPIAGDAKLLLTGTVPEGEQPVAWTRRYKGGKLVYIALGGLQDWNNPNFTNLVSNSLFWVAGFKGKRISKITKQY